MNTPKLWIMWKTKKFTTLPTALLLLLSMLTLIKEEEKEEKRTFLMG